MGITLGSNFTVNTALPLDDRMTVADTTARDAIDAGRRFIGLTVHCLSDSKNYQLQGGILNANWVELPSAGTSKIFTSFTVSQSIANGATTKFTTLTSVEDLGGCLLTSGRWTCQQTGWYLITWNMNFPVGTAALRIIGYYLNGGGSPVNVHAGPGYSGVGSTYSPATVVKFNTNDYVEFSVLQSTGGSETISGPISVVGI